MAEREKREERRQKDGKRDAVADRKNDDSESGH